MQEFTDKMFQLEGKLNCTLLSFFIVVVVVFLNMRAIS